MVVGLGRFLSYIF